MTSQPPLHTAVTFCLGLGLGLGLFSAATTATTAAGAEPAATPPPPPPLHLECAITRGAGPGGTGPYTGTVTFHRTSVDEPFEVTWTLPTGTRKGWGVPFPKSPCIAVGYGRDLGGVAIYKQLKDGTSDARFIIAGPGAKIGSYTIKRGAERGQYVYGDGTPGGIQINKEGDTRGFNIKYVMSTGAWSGLGVAEGDCLAAASSTGGTDYGVVIYKNVQDRATGFWRSGATPGVGEEDLQFLSVDGRPLTPGAPGSHPGPGPGPGPATASTTAPAPAASTPAASSSASATAGTPDEVRALAAALRGNASLLQEMKPTAAHIAAITATPEAAAKLTAYVEKLFTNLPAEGLTARPEQTQILVKTGEDLPGGYAQNAAHLKPGLTIHGFEYVIPGETAGISYDGLVKLDGKWIFIPKMWRAFTAP